MVITVNGSEREFNRRVGGYGNDSHTSTICAPRSVRASADRYRDLGASKAKHRRDDDKVWMDRKWDR